MDYVSWLIIAAGLIILEMFFGSFYILPFGLAAAIVAVFSWMEYDLSVQEMVYAAIVAADALGRDYQNC